MTDPKTVPAQPARQNNDPPKTDRSKHATDQTGAGQEATQGSAPHQRDGEHQSNYGGGGENGGSGPNK
jgi:hypothetical protein